MSILIKQALLDGKVQDILVEGRLISRIAPEIPDHLATRLIDAKGLAAIPGFYNCHTHAAMTLFRGYGDDLKLMDWLENWIWPVEKHMNEEDVYWGSRLACLEMIKSGTIGFLDMYSFPMATARAVEESGLRAVLSYTLFDRGDAERAKLDRENSYRYYDEFARLSDRVQFSLGPHAIYTVSGEQLQFCHRFAQEKDVLIHLHLSETEGERLESIEKYGLSPVRYLDKLGILSPNLVLAHALWLDEGELELIAKHDVKLVHNPASNMKLASGYRFLYEEMLEQNISVGIGTDGCSSSNNLDMCVAMKLAALMGKAWRQDPTANTAAAIYHTATSEGASIMRMPEPSLKEGAVADFCLANLRMPEMIPNHNLVSNLVYSASGSVIDSTLVNGELLMHKRVVPGECELLDKAEEMAYELMNKSK